MASCTGTANRGTIVVQFEKWGKSSTTFRTDDGTLRLDEPSTGKIEVAATPSGFARIQTEARTMWVPVRAGHTTRLYSHPCCGIAFESCDEIDRCQQPPYVVIVADQPRSLWWGIGSPEAIASSEPPSTYAGNPVQPDLGGMVGFSHHPPDPEDGELEPEATVRVAIPPGTCVWLRAGETGVEAVYDAGPLKRVEGSWLCQTPWTPLLQKAKQCRAESRTTSCESDALGEARDLCLKVTAGRGLDTCNRIRVEPN